MEESNVKSRKSIEAHLVGAHSPPRKSDQPENAGLVATGLRHARRAIVLIIGGVVLLAGIIMLVTPGPGLIGITAGLGILSIEFSWARSLLHKFKHQYMNVRNAIHDKTSSRTAKHMHNP